MLATSQPSTVDQLLIISGGQTGVDRAALDAAISAGAPCGGWCPKGRRAEDGPIPQRYPLTEMSGPDYLARTRKNVDDSDATLIIAFGEPSGGTRRTVEFCRRLGKPHLIVDATVLPLDDASRLAMNFVKGSGIRRLNVAGPRASGEPQGYPYALALVQQLLNNISASQQASAS